MAGHLVYVGCAMTTNAGVGVFIGQGSEVFVGAGSAAIHAVSFSANIGVHYYSEGLVGFYVMGRECEVKIEENEEGSVSLAERGYGICSHKFGDGEGEIESHVVVQGLRGRQRFGGWRDELEPLRTGPGTLYIGPNVSSCALCGLEGVQTTGPGVEEGGACPAAGEEARACPENATAPPVPAAPVLAAAATAIGGTTVVNNGVTAATTTTNSSGDKKGLFGFGGRLRRFLGEEGGSTTGTTTIPPASSSSSSAPTAKSGEPFVFPAEAGDDELPDTHVLILDLSIWCRTGAEGCPDSTVSVQHALERTWLGGLEEGREGTDGARLVVTQYKSPSALKASLGIPPLGGDADEADVTGSGARRVLVSAPSGCGTAAQELVFVAYAHTTDKATADALKARAKATPGAAPLNSTLAAALGGGDALCSSEVSLRQAFFVPAPAAKRLGGAAPLGSEGGLDFAMLPRVWVNITSPVVQVGKAYDVTISHFDQGDRVGLHLVPSPRSATGGSSEPPLFFQTAPRLLYTFRAFDEGKGNATWTWEVSPLLAKSVGPGPFFLKAFDTKDPGRFVLSQAFDITSSSGKREQQRKRHRRTQGYDGHAHAILRKLSSTQGGEEPAAGAGVDDMAMMQTVLSTPKNKAATADFWSALLAMPSAQKALGDPALARTLLRRAPVLRSASEVAALDEAGGWEDAAKVRSAMVSAIKSFADMALRTMRTTASTAPGQQPGTAARNWPTRVLESLTPEEAALARQVAKDGDVGAMGALMDSQAAHLFGGAFFVFVF